MSLLITHFALHPKFVLFLVFCCKMISLKKGFRFQPNDEDLVSDFLKEKKRNPAVNDPIIKEIDLYNCHPSELPGLSSIQSDEQVWYFFCKLEQKYANGDCVRRTAKGGYWKKTGVDRKVKAKDSNKQIGIKKYLVFYKGSNTKKENKTDWKMHEYHEYPCKKNCPSKGELVVCRIEKKADNKREPASAIDEGQSSDDLAYDCGNNVSEDISQVEPQLPQNLSLASGYNNDVANNNLMQVETHPLLLPQHIPSLGENHVAKYIFPESESQLLPNQHMSPTIGDHVAKYISPELESQLLPKQHVSPIVGDHVAKATMSQLESQLLLPNFHASSTIEDHLRNNSFSEMEPQLLPNQHTSSNFEDYVAKSMFFEIESQLLANHQLSSNIENNDAKCFPSEVRPLLPAQPEELVDCNGLDQNSFSSLQSPHYQTPGSSYSSCFSNELALLLNQNSFSALQSPINLPPVCSFSDNSTNGLDLNIFSALHSPSQPQPGSSCSSGYSNDLTNGLDYNYFSALHFPIRPLPESSYSNSFSSNSTNGFDHSSVSALQSPIYPQPESSYSSGYSNDLNVWTPYFAVEQEDELANSHRYVQDDFSSPETAHTFSPDFNASKAVAGGYVGADGSDAVVTETVFAWPNDYFPIAHL